MGILANWMSVFLLAAAMVLATSAAHATHLMGGEMSVAYVGDNAAGVPQYEVHCFVYRDCSSANANGTDFDLFASIGIYEGGVLAETLSLPLDQTLVENVVPENPNNCAFLPEDLCLERAEYIGVVALEPSQIGYDFVYQRCCRSPAITNLVTPEDQGFTIRTNVPPASIAAPGNSTPTFNALPQAFVCNQYPFSISHAATDADGDSLAYKICDIYLGGDPAAPMPTPPLPPPYANVTWASGFSAADPFGLNANVNINPLTGVMTGLPIQVGKFSVGICVEEWRNGVMIGGIQRDFTIDVVNCEILAPLYEPIASCEGLSIGFELQGAPADEYVWDFGVPGTDDDISTDPEPSYTYDTPGQYDISMFFSSGGCSDSLHFTVAVAEPWTLDVETGELACNSDGTWAVPVDVDMSDWPPGASWTWAAGGNAWTDSLLTAVHLPPGDQILSLTTSWFDCQESAAVALDLPPMPVAGFSMSSSPCGELEATFAADDPASGPFEWSFGGSAAGATGPVVTQSFPTYGSFDVSLIAGVGSACESTSSSTITLYPPDPLNGSVDVHPLSLCDSTGWMQVVLNGMAADDLSWSFPAAADVLDADFSGATLFFAATGTYGASVALINEACDEAVELDFDIEVPEPLNGVEYAAPNVFSPNNDTKNERFAITQVLPDGTWASLPTGSSFETFDLRIFNRWGLEVFATSNPGGGWRANDSPEGTYFWTLDAKHLCDAAPVGTHGVVTVVR